MLTITSAQRLEPGQEPVKTLDSGSATIGRAPDCDWVLPDPDRVVSHQHCTVENRNGDYYLTDTSTNGVFVNHAEQRISRGQSVKLGDGDMLAMGSYEIQVSITPTAEAGTELIPAGFNEAQTDVLATPVTPKPGPEPDNVLADNGAAPADISGTDHLFAEASKLGSSGSGASILPEDVDFLGLEPQAPKWSATTQPDNLPPDQQYIEPPQPRAAESHPPAPPPAEAQQVATQAPQPAEKPKADKIPTAFDLLYQQLPPAESPAPTEPQTEKIPPAAAATPTESPPPATAAATPAESPPPATAAATPAAPPAATAAVDKAALQAFLAGAGLSQLAIDEADIPRFMETQGKIFRQVVQGMMEMLASRRQVKSEFRLEQTMVRPSANNPLKVFPNPQEAMAMLLAGSSSAYLPAEQAFREGFDDIKAHQLAVMAGTQAAFDHLLKRFNPHNLEQRFGKQSLLDNVLSSKRKAKCWDLFNALFDEIAGEMEDDFQELFGKAFARAYEEQMARMRNKP